MKADAGAVGFYYDIFNLGLEMQTELKTEYPWQTIRLYLLFPHPDSIATVLLYIIDHLSLLYPHWSEYLQLSSFPVHSSGATLYE